MKHVRTLAALIVVFAVGFVWVSARQDTSGSGALTGQDYGEIEALYSRYNQGSDFRDDELFLSAFSEDAVIVRADGSKVEGMAALRASRPKREAGETRDAGRRHRTGSYLITPTADGAKGRAYYILLDVTTRPPTMRLSGVYEDEFVRTPDGWRIKRRFINRDMPTR